MQCATFAEFFEKGIFTSELSIISGKKTKNCGTRLYRTAFSTNKCGTEGIQYIHDLRSHIYGTQHTYNIRQLNLLDI